MRVHRPVPDSVGTGFGAKCDQALYGTADYIAADATAYADLVSLEQLSAV